MEAELESSILTCVLRTATRWHPCLHLGQTTLSCLGFRSDTQVARQQHLQLRKGMGNQSVVVCVATSKYPGGEEPTAGFIVFNSWQLGVLRTPSPAVLRVSVCGI